MGVDAGIRGEKAGRRRHGVGVATLERANECGERSHFSCRYDVDERGAARCECLGVRREVPTMERRHGDGGWIDDERETFGVERDDDGARGVELSRREWFEVPGVRVHGRRRERCGGREANRSIGSSVRGEQRGMERERKRHRHRRRGRRRSFVERELERWNLARTDDGTDDAIT